MSKSNLEKAPSLYRTDVARGLAAGLEVSGVGGRYGAGLIEGFAVITRGEALGHGFWIDRDFVSQVNTALAGNRSGVKSRFTHPDLSGDGLAKGLGRVYWRESEDEDISRGDLHLWESSRKSPDGDLGGYILERAKEDPESFGASIAFVYDLEATKAHFLANGGKVTDWGEWDSSGFRSPDPLNVLGLPHARLAELRAVDIVDDPAANPAGLFHRDETLKSAESLLEYALGLSDRKPEIASFGVDPDRAGGFVRRFLKNRGLSLMKLKSLNEAGVLEDEATTAAEGSNVEAQDIQDEGGDPGTVQAAESETDKKEAGDQAAAPSGEAPALSARKECRRFVDAFGAARGAEWFASGLSFEEATARFAAELKSENEKLKRQLQAAAQAEAAPLSSGGADEKRGGSSRAGFAGKIRLPVPSRN
jgi:hypothetical protein